MKVSFVVPVYKKDPKQLRNCLKSLFAQSHKDIEVVVVFDGADAELEAVAKEFPKARTAVIEHGGAPKARNFGTEMSTGDVVACWDADCYAEPEMAAVWVMTFEDHPDCDFVYSGYRFTDINIPGFESEPFDPWILNKYNYIASMFPVRRKALVKWDESLDGMQDWDFWRQIVANGSKGRYIPGFGWATDTPRKEDISGSTPRPQQVERIEKVRRKNEDIKHPILVHGTIFRREAVQVAKLLDADYFFNPYWRTRDYRLTLMVGMHPWELSASGALFASSTRCVVYWKGFDADNFFNAPYHQTKLVAQTAKDLVYKHLCGDKRTQDILHEMGLEADLLPFPRMEGAAVSELPKEFRVLAFHDETHQALIKSVIRAMPDVKFEVVVPEKALDINNYTVGLQFTRSPRLEQGSLNMLMNGRYLISNVQAEYAGFIDFKDVTQFKDEIINKLREYQKATGPNTSAQEFYLNQTSPEAFKKAILALVPELEAVQ